MDEFLKMLFEAAKEGKVQVIQIGTEPKTKEPVDIYAEAKKEAAEIAELNRILYEAHINAGFTGAEALALVAAQNN